MAYKEQSDRQTKSIDRTLQHAEEVKQAVPVPAQAPQPSNKPAPPTPEQQIKGMIGKVELAENEVSKLIRGSAFSQSAKFDEAAKGHEEPQMYVQKKGEAKVRDKILIYLGDAAPYLIRSDLSNRDAHVTEQEVRAEDVRAHAEVYSGDMVSNWMTPGYLGEEIAGKFRKFSPRAIVPDGMKEGTAGFYIEGGNMIFLDPGFRGTYEDIQYAISHEMLHYASYLGGGGGVRFIDEQGNKRVVGDITWFNEGLTDLHAQQLCRENGVTPSFVGYDIEVQVALYMQKLLGEGGEETLKKAYLTGDFTEVRKAIDAKLGTGTFDQLIAKERGVEGLVFLRGKMAEKGIDTSAWDKDPIMVTAWVQGA